MVLLIRQIPLMANNRRAMSHPGPISRSARSRRVPVHLLAACATWLGSAGVRAQTAESVDLVAVYEAAVARPESFATYLENQRGALRSAPFAQCITYAKDRLTHIPRAHANVCRRYLPPGEQQECVNRSDPANFLRFLRSIEQVLGSKTEWPETPDGSLLLDRQQRTDARGGPGAYASNATGSLKRMATVNRFYLRCPDARPPTPASAPQPKSRPSRVEEPDARAVARRLCLREHRARWKRCPGKKNRWGEKRSTCLGASSGLYASCLEKHLPSYDPLVRGARCRERAFRELSRKTVAACDRAERAARKGLRPDWPYSGLW